MRRLAAGFARRRGVVDSSGKGTNSSPEENASRGIKLFCESGNPNDQSAEGQEYLHLPTIVEAAESSPAAANAAAYQIRKLLHENYQKPYVQYNAIMLIRILADNPGRSFTKNLDEKFRSTILALLQKGNDPSVHQLLIETLNALETEKAFDENLIPLTTMWRKEKGMVMQRLSGAAPQAAIPWSATAGGSRPARERSQKKLPSPAELSGRIEESRMSAQLLMQVTQSTTASELVRSGLAREFAERCQTAQRNLQGYMNCTDPAPDEHTFQTLIETCEQLNVALSKHQRAMLAARRETMSQPPMAQPPMAQPPLASHPANQVTASPPPISQPHRRDTAPMAPVPQQPPSSRNPYYTLNGTPQRTLYYPPTNTTSPRPAANPFSDNNQVVSRSAPGQQITTDERTGPANRQTYMSLPPPASGVAELALSSTPPLGATVTGPVSSIPHGQMLDDDFQPPIGPPPNRASTFPLQRQAPTDLARPTTQDSDDLYSSNSPVAEDNPSLSSAADPSAKYGSQSQGQVSEASEENWAAQSSAWAAGTSNQSSATYGGQYQAETPPRRQGSTSKNPFTPPQTSFTSSVGAAEDFESQQVAPHPQYQVSPDRSPPPPSPPKQEPSPMNSFQIHSTPSYIRRQDAAVGTLTMSGGSSNLMTPSTTHDSTVEASSYAPRRIKDDDPMTPMSAGAWQSGQY